MKNKKISVLVVDDADVIRSLFIDLLTEHGYEVIAVKNGREAVEEVRGRDFTIAFIDVHMPVMNGLEALRTVKKIRPQTVIVMTDSSPDELLEQSRKEGAVTCIHKPFDIKEVFRIMEEVAGQRKKV